MKFHNPLLSLGTDALSGKPYHICSRKVCVCVFMWLSRARMTMD